MTDEELRMRRVEVDTLLQAKLKPRDYDTLARGMSPIRLALMMMPILVGEDLWPVFWGLLKEEVDHSAVVILKAESEKPNRPTIF